METEGKEVREDMLVVAGKIGLVILAIVVGVLVANNLKYHNRYEWNDTGLKQTLAFNWLVMVILFIYLIYKLVTL